MKDYKQIHIQKLASSSTKERYLLIYNGLYFEAGEAVIELLSCLQDKSSEEEAIAVYIEKKGGIYSYEDVQKLIIYCIEPIFTKKASVKKQIFLYQHELVPSATIDRYSNLFHILFRPLYMYLFMVITIALNIYFFYTENNLLVFNSSTNAYTIASLLLFVLISSFFHELGHASACKYFGIRHGGIGFGLYLNIPVLYTDVTEIWKLPRNQRLVVNIAGVYFQMYILLALLISYIFTNSEILRYMILVVNLGFIMTLNPFFKFDGYWIASDLLGIPNLRQRSKSLLIFWINKVCRRKNRNVSYLKEISPLNQYGLLVYSIIVNIFMGYYLFYILPNFIVSFIHSFPEEIHQLVIFLSNGISPSFALLRNIAMQTLLVLFIGIFIFNFIKSLRKYVR